MKNSSENNDLNDTILGQLISESFCKSPSAEETEKEWNRFRNNHILKQKRRRLWTMVSAAAVVFAVAIGISISMYSGYDTEKYVFTAMNAETEYVAYEENGNIRVFTPAATQTRVVLDDGTKVLLDANSSLSYPEHFTGNERRVFLTGRARFEVKSDSLNPFFVVSKNLAVCALGTVFDVKSFSGIDPEVSLYKGKVRVELIESKRKCMLFPGESVIVGAGNDMIPERTSDDMYGGWSDREFVFDNVALLDVMKEIGAWYNISIGCSDFKLLDKRVYFHVSRSVSAGTIVEMLNDMDFADFSMANDRIVIRAKRK